MLEQVKNVSVGSDELKFCTGRDANCSNVVGVIIVQDEYVSIAAGGWNEERASLIGGNVTSGLKTRRVDMVSFCWMLDGIVNVMRRGVLTVC